MKWSIEVRKGELRNAAKLREKLLPTFEKGFESSPRLFLEISSGNAITIGEIAKIFEIAWRAGRRIRGAELDYRIKPGARQNSVKLTLHAAAVAHGDALKSYA